MKAVKFVCILLFVSTYSYAQSLPEYDIVLTGGRVMDPETKLDAVKNIGIIHNRIATVWC